MFDSIYKFFEKIGYPHPLHPSEVHLPIGLVIGAAVFGLTSYLFRRLNLQLSARHCIILAFLLLFPTVLCGFMDWQHYYSGTWMFPIKVKITLTTILFVLLATSIFLNYKLGAGSKSVLVINVLCFCTVVGIGYEGGNLVYSGWSPNPPKEFKIGAEIFKSNCSACHPSGGNVMAPNLPLVNAPQIDTFDNFIAYIRNPKMPGGSLGSMPKFPESKISDDKARELYQYIINVLKNPKRS